MPQIADLHVIVQFGKGIPARLQGPALLEFERLLRAATGNELWIEVFKEVKGDDSKLRTSMTKEQRDAL